MAKRKKLRRETAEVEKERPLEVIHTAKREGAVKKLKKKKKKRIVPSQEAIATPTVPSMDATQAVEEGSVKKGKRKKKHLFERKHEEVCETPASPANLPAGLPAIEALLRHCGGLVDAIEVRADDGPCGVGVFARRSIAAGEVAFMVPSSLVLVSGAAVTGDNDAVVASVAGLLQTWGKKDMEQFLTCLRLCRARASSSRADDFYKYASNLPDSVPGAASWPPAFRGLLAASTLKVSLTDADEELDSWQALLERVFTADTKVARLRDTFGRPHLECARGILQSHMSKSHATVPLLGLLYHRQAPNVSVETYAARIELKCQSAVKAGEKISLGPGSKGNEELLMSHGFAIEGNKFNKMSLSVEYTEKSTNAIVKSVVQADSYGIPEAVVDKIEEEQNDAHFGALLQSVLVQRRATKETLGMLPKALNFNVCKGPLARGRKKSIEDFLEDQLKMCQVSLDEMEPPDLNPNEEGGSGGSSDGEGEEGLVDVDGENDLEMEEDEPAWKRRRKR